MIRNKLGSFTVYIKYFIECDIVVCELPLFVRFEEAMLYSGSTSAVMMSPTGLSCLATARPV
jgi:hypothetical protein